MRTNSAENKSHHALSVPRKLLKDDNRIEIRRASEIVQGIRVPKDDPIFTLGTNPIRCGIPDASNELDNYLYLPVA